MFVTGCLVGVYLFGDSFDCPGGDVRVVVVVVSDGALLGQLVVTLGNVVELDSFSFGVDAVGVQETEHLLVVDDLVIHLGLLLGQVLGEETGGERILGRG